MLVKEFVRCIVIANIFAWPIAYFVIKDWIEDYAYRIIADNLDYSYLIASAGFATAALTAW